MRVIQYRILGLLNTVPIPDYIYGFEMGKSIPQMASLHVGQRVVISLDIKDYFGSIKQYRVMELFKALGMSGGVAKICSELCTYKAFVPQGALTSPKISNLITAGTFGKELEAYCKEAGLTLTVYADDITVSYGDELTFPTRLDERNFQHGVIATISSLVKLAGFRINREKTKIMAPGRRKWVCGAVVNERVNMLRKERNNLRAIVHNCTKNGITAEAAKAGMQTLDFVRKYSGRLNWLSQLNEEKGKALWKQFKELARPLTKLYPDFHIEKWAYDSGQEDPGPVEEGKLEASTPTVVADKDPFSA